jgi:hypothetical protein
VSFWVTSKMSTRNNGDQTLNGNSEHIPPSDKSCWSKTKIPLTGLQICYNLGPLEPSHPSLGSTLWVMIQIIVIRLVLN